jgi:hypothetical protein
MSLLSRRAPARSLTLVLVSSLTATLAGCGSGTSGVRPDELEQAAKGYQQNPVAKCSGRVTIDNEPPGKDGLLFVVLIDPEHPDKARKGQAVSTTCDEDGKFSFTTYLRDDGAPQGKYIATFAFLKRGTGREGGPRTGGMGVDSTQAYIGPDKLKNLYNDPEKNKSEPTFQIDVAPPGRTDYEFNLAVAGKDPVLKAGPNAVTHMVR